MLPFPWRSHWDLGWNYFGLLWFKNECDIFDLFYVQWLISKTKLIQHQRVPLCVYQRIESQALEPLINATQNTQWLAVAFAAWLHLSLHCTISPCSLLLFSLSSKISYMLLRLFVIIVAVWCDLVVSEKVVIWKWIEWNTVNVWIIRDIKIWYLKLSFDFFFGANIKVMLFSF